MQKRYWKKNKRQKFTDDFIKSLQPPSVKFEKINDTKSNILVRNYRSGGKVFWAYYWFKNQTIYSWLGKWAARIPMMATTTRSSIRVKAFWFIQIN